MSLARPCGSFGLQGLGFGTECSDGFEDRGVQPANTTAAGRLEESTDEFKHMDFIFCQLLRSSVSHTMAVVIR